VKRNPAGPVLSLLILALLIPVIPGAITAGAAESGHVIDSVVVDNRDIFMIDSSRYDYWIYRLANKLHFTTRKFIIRRELLQSTGDTFSRRLADETERNLRSLDYIWNAAITFQPDDNGPNIMKVTTNDTWTMSAGLSIDRKARENTCLIQFEESNLLGLGQFLSLKYYLRDFDADYGVVSVRERRLLGSRLFGEFYYNDDPENGLKGITFGLPFYSLSAPFSFRCLYFAEKRRDDYYRNGIIEASNHARGTDFDFEAAWRFGSYREKLVTRVYFSYRDIAVFDKRVRVSGGYNGAQPYPFPSDSLYYSFTPEVAFQYMDYITTSRINGFRRSEDFLTGSSASVAFGWAIDPSRRRTIFKTAGFALGFSDFIRSNLFFVNFAANSWFLGNVTYRKMFNLSIKYYNNLWPWLTTAINVRFDEDIRRDGLPGLHLGENNGLRGYPKNHLSGRRRFFGNIENRLFSGIQILSVEFGAVQFFDFGHAWIRQRDVHLKDILWSTGVGLRFGLEKISNTGLMRVDFAYGADIDDWQLSLGLGQYFK